MKTRVSVLRGERDFTNNGISKDHDHFYLVWNEENPPAEIDGMPVLKLVERYIGGRYYRHAEPIGEKPGMVGPMSGGNFVYSCGSPFPNDYPISIHDRYETPEEYAILSR